MQLVDDVRPHEWLTATGAASKLRPLRRQPLSLQRYRCSLCGTMWIRELDPLQPLQDSWICLHEAQSILDPVSVSAQKVKAPVHADKANQQQNAVESDLFEHRFS
jgi:hypothetical protein